MIKILFAGEGGQGVQAIAEILAKAAFTEKKFALYIPNFGVEQRGGASLAFVMIDSKPVAYPKFQTADILAVLSNRSLKRVEQYLDKKTKIILGPAVKNGMKTELPPETWNILVLGKVNGNGKIVNKQSLISAMNEKFASRFEKSPNLKMLDLKALNQ